MKNRDISIKLEQTIEECTNQRFDRQPGDIGQGPWTSVVESDRYYTIVQMRNAACIEWGTGKNERVLRVGDKLTEQEADSIARCRVFDVTIVR